MWVGQLPATSSVWALVYSPDGRTLYSGDLQGYVLAWDVATRSHRVLFRRSKLDEEMKHRGVNWLWLSRDGSRLLVNDTHQLFDALHPEGGPVLDVGDGGPDRIRLIFPDGRRAAQASPDTQWRMEWWCLETALSEEVPGPLGRATKLVWQALLPDGVTLLTCKAGFGRGGPDELTLWDVCSGEPIGELPSPGEHLCVTPIGPALCLSPGGQTLVVAQQKALLVYNVLSRSIRHRITLKRCPGVLAFHPSGRLLAVVLSSSEVALWDVLGPHLVERHNWDCGSVRALAFAPDGQTCAAGGYGKIVVWDVDQG
jgi:WD40 repeat protein